jgi:hypothetical protein
MKQGAKNINSILHSLLALILLLFIVAAVTASWMQRDASYILKVGVQNFEPLQKQNAAQGGEFPRPFIQLLHYLFISNLIFYLLCGKLIEKSGRCVEVL